MQVLPQRNGKRRDDVALRIRGTQDIDGLAGLGRTQQRLRSSLSDVTGGHQRTLLVGRGREHRVDPLPLCCVEHVEHLLLEMTGPQRSHCGPGGPQCLFHPIQNCDGPGPFGQICASGGEHDHMRYALVSDRRRDRPRERFGVSVRVVAGQVERKQDEEPRASLQSTAVTVQPPSSSVESSPSMSPPPVSSYAASPPACSSAEAEPQRPPRSVTPCA